MWTRERQQPKIRQMAHRLTGRCKFQWPSRVLKAQSPVFRVPPGARLCFTQGRRAPGAAARALTPPSPLPRLPRLQRVNNTQHATMYSCFVMSGVVSILAYHLRLPAGVDKAYLALAFLGEALLMGLHEKHDPLVGTALL